MQANGFRHPDGGDMNVTLKEEWRAPRGSAAHVLLAQATKGMEEGSAARTALERAFLELLVENSVRKSELSRRRVAGASLDMRRAFAERAYAGSWAVADFETATEQHDAMRDMWKQAKSSSRNAVQMGEVARELQLRDQKSLEERKISATEQALSKMGFFWYLFSPSYTVVNLTQVPLVAGPYLAAKFGMGRATKALGKAYRAVFAAGAKEAWDLKGGFAGTTESSYERMRAAMSPAEQQMLDELNRRGIIDSTFAQELVASGQGRDRGLADRVMDFARTMPQVAELVNRLTVATATYNLAKQAGRSDADATEAAAEAVLQTQFDYCVDDATECLTTDGWKRWDELTLEDTLLAVDKEGKAVESALLDVNVFHGAREINLFDHGPNRHFSMAVTDHHKCLVQNYNSRDKKWQSILEVEAAELKDGHHILRRPLLQLDRVSEDPDFAALLGWVAAEGDYGAFRNCKEKRRVGLGQSLTANPQYVEEIEALLERLGGHYRKFVIHDGTLAYFTLKKPLSTRVLAAMPNKKLTPQMLRDFGTEEMQALTDAFLKGDGHQRNGGHWTVTQKDAQNIDVLQGMFTLLGKTATRGVESPAGMHPLHVSDLARSMTKEMRRSKLRVDMVWCPTTEHGTWIARRNGAVFVTGNSDLNKPRYFKAFTLARPIMMFKMYAQGMYMLTIGNLMKSFRADTPQARKEARRMLAGVLATHTLAAGALGGLFIEPVRAIMAVAAFAFGDGDEPWDLDNEVTQFLADLLGPEAAQLVARGVPRGVGIDLSGRVGLNHMAFMGNPDARSYEEAWKNLVLQFLGPMAALSTNVVRGADYVRKNEYQKAMEAASPKIVRDLLRAERVGREGLTDYNGNVIADPAKFDLHDFITQAMGFSPATTARTYEGREAQKAAETKLNDRRKALMQQWRRADDRAGFFRENIRDFNRTNPEFRITMGQLQRGLREQQRRERQTTAGYATEKKSIRRIGEAYGV
jgi:hypothetical protein